MPSEQKLRKDVVAMPKLRNVTRSAGPHSDATERICHVRCSRGGCAPRASVWFSSNLDRSKTVEQILGGGKLAVH